MDAALILWLQNFIQTMLVGMTAILVFPLVLMMAAQPTTYVTIWH